MNSEKVFFQTSDFITIFGDFYQPAEASRMVLLLHMMPAVRTSFEPLQKALYEAGVASLSIDLRGHGESTMNSTLDWKKFSEHEHQASRLDVDAAMNWLKAKHFEEKNISFVGASIGANLSLDSLTRYKDTSSAVLLSPGLEYRAVKTLPALHDLSSNQRVWFIAAEQDSYSAQSSQTLYETRSSNSKLTIYKGPDHGTDLFASEPPLVSEIVTFLQD